MDRRRVARDLVVVLVFAVLWFWNARQPWVVTAWSGLNGFLYVSATLAFPVLLIVQIFRFRARSTTVLGWVLLLPLFFYAILPFPVMLLIASDGSWAEEVSAIPFGWTKVRANELNGGATTDFGYELRQELTVFPGID